jgi:hypothetical protein
MVKNILFTMKEIIENILTDKTMRIPSRVETLAAAQNDFAAWAD